MVKINKFQKHSCPKQVRLWRKISKAGFSLIEVLVAMLVLSMGFAAVFSLMTINIRSSENAKNQIIASQLAQEGLELVRNLRDNGSLDASYPDSAACTPASKCIDLRIDKDDTVLNTSTALSKLLYLNNNFYTHTAGTATKFFRKIDLSITGDKNATPSSTRVITVTSYVTWNGTGVPATCNIGNKCVSAVSVLPDYLSN